MRAQRHDGPSPTLEAYRRRHALNVFVVVHPDPSEAPYVFATEAAARRYLGADLLDFAQRCPVLTETDVSELAEHLSGAELRAELENENYVGGMDEHSNA